MNECSKIVVAIVWIRNKHKNECKPTNQHLTENNIAQSKTNKNHFNIFGWTNFEGNCLVQCKRTHCLTKEIEQNILFIIMLHIKFKWSFQWIHSKNLAENSLFSVGFSYFLARFQTFFFPNKRTIFNWSFQYLILCFYRLFHTD